jgi:outer membrane protein
MTGIGPGQPISRHCAAACACILLASLLMAQGAHANEPLWELGLGAGALRLPHYRGSDQAHNWLLPVPYAVYRGKIFRATREGARAVLLDSERLDVDVSVAASAPTRSSGNRARAGMPDLAATVELGPNLNFNLARGAGWKLDLRIPVHAVATLEKGSQGIGWTAMPVVNLDTRVAGWNLGLQAGVLYGSREYHQFFYGVDMAYARPERSAYRADGGYGGSRFTVGASRRMGAFWVGTYVRADSVAGARFESSPLVKQRNTVSAGLALSWVFAASGQRVAVED